MADRVGQQLGNYRLLRLLGQGAFAAVYLGEHQYLERPAAIKVLHVQIEPGSHESFRREARTIAQLDHPHIIRVHDFGIDGQTPYLVMEYTPNGTLRSRHPKGTRLPFEQIVTYVKQIASALDYAHEQQVIHCDVKPENILLGSKQQVVLSDFGLAVVQHTLDSLSTHDLAGTPVYMAPEQIQRKPCAASDQYALGMMVYEWITGEPPFRGFLYEVFNQHLHEPPPSLCARFPGLPSAVEDAVFGTLSKDPQQRFARVADFATVLEEAVFGTQLLSLHGSLEHRTQDEATLALAYETLVPVPSPGEQDRSDEATQLRLGTGRHLEHEQEPVSSVSTPPAMHSRTVPRPIKRSLVQTNRQRLLRRVRSFWITGVFEQSLHSAALLALGLQAHPDAVANPWHLVVQHPETASQPLPTGTRITQVYDAADGELLILGAPGSGKTTLLLELARDLLERAEHEEQHPMPVVFNLSSWAMKQLPLVDWLVEELVSKYQVPRKLGQAFVDTDQILPLLDGLDEVAPKSRTVCIEAINRYREVHGFLPLVVCSRSADYLAQTTRILLRSAVAVQPLTEAQVDDYLARGGEPLWALRVALHQDAALRDLTHTPLMLVLLILTYQGSPVEDLLRTSSPLVQQRQVFAQYVQRMLARQGVATSAPSRQMRHWLSFLARQMKRENQTVFYLERLQPDWLSGDRMLQIYERWAIWFPAILIGMLVSLTITPPLFSTTRLAFSLLAENALLGGFVGWLLGAARSSAQRDERSARARGSTWSRLVGRLRVGGLIGLSYGLGAAVNVGLEEGAELRYWLVAGVINGLSVGLGSILLQVLLEKSKMILPGVQPRPPSRELGGRRFLRSPNIRNGLLTGLLLGLSAGLGAGVAFGLTDGMAGARLSTALSEGLGTGVGIGLAFGLATGLSGGLLSRLLSGQTREIVLTDRLVWSWRSLRQSLFTKKHLSRSLPVMTFVALLYGLSLWPGYAQSYGMIAGLTNGLSYGVLAALTVGLSSWMWLGLFEGVASETIGDQHRVVPNQGIRRSARHSLVWGLISTGIVGLSAGLIIGDFGWTVWLIALSVGFLAGLLNGGLATLRHYLVRFLLWRTHRWPWALVPVLDEATERILLRRVGGGYIFVHRLLLEYFAALDTPSLSDTAGAQKQRAVPVRE